MCPWRRWWFRRTSSRSPSFRTCSRPDLGLPGSPSRLPRACSSQKRSELLDDLRLVPELVPRVPEGEPSVEDGGTVTSSVVGHRLQAGVPAATVPFQEDGGARVGEVDAALSLRPPRERDLAGRLPQPRLP